VTILSFFETSSDSPFWYFQTVIPGVSKLNERNIVLKYDFVSYFDKFVVVLYRMQGKQTLDLRVMYSLRP